MDSTTQMPPSPRIRDQPPGQGSPTPTVGGSGAPGGPLPQSTPGAGGSSTATGTIAMDAPSTAAKFPAPQAPQAITSKDLAMSPAAQWLQSMENQLAVGMIELPQPARLAGLLEEKFQEYRNRRMMLEQEWLECAFRYNGQYYGTVRARLDAQPNKSKLWVDLTRMFVDAAHADNMEVLRGSGSFQPWSFNAEPLPETLDLPPELAAKGITVQMLQQEIDKRARGMETVIRNQLQESSFKAHLEAGSFEQSLYGTGAIKGPMTISAKSYKWMLEFDDNMAAIASKVQRMPYRPALTYVPIVNVYANMERQVPQLSDGVIEEYPCTRRDIMDMAEWPGFIPEALLAILKTWPDGNYQPLPHTIQLRSIHLDSRPSYSTLYGFRILYGEVKGRELRQAGVKLNRDLDSLSIPCEVWWCGNYVVCARPLPLHRLPIHLFPYRIRGTNCPYGQGVPIQVRWCQDAVNGAGRMIMDNAAAASGPMIEWNEALMRMDPGNDPNDIRGFKVFVSSHDGNNNKQAVRAIEIKPYTEMFLGIIRTFVDFAHAITGINSVTQGLTGSSTPSTATGTGILNTNGFKTRNTTLRFLDDYLLEPLIAAFYEWNMEYGDDESIKVPGYVEAEGSAALMEREQMSQRLIQAIQISTGQPWFKIRNAARRLFRALGLPVDEVTMTDSEWAQFVAQTTQPPPGGQGATGAGQLPGQQAPEQPPPTQPGQPGALPHQQPMTTPSTLPSGGAETMP